MEEGTKGSLHTRRVIGLVALVLIALVVVVVFQNRGNSVPLNDTTGYTKNEISTLQKLNRTSGYRPAGPGPDIKTVLLTRKQSSSKQNLSSLFSPTRAYADGLQEARLLVYLVPDLSQPGYYKFYNYSLTEGKAGQLIDGSFKAPIQFSLSSKGYLMFITGNDLYQYDIVNRLLSMFNTEDTCRAGCSYQGPFPPSISTDGSKIAFFENYNGKQLLIRSLVEGKQVVFNIPENVLKNDIIWASDDQRVYLRTSEGQTEDGIGIYGILELNLSTSEILPVNSTTSSPEGKDQISFFDSDDKSSTLLYVGTRASAPEERFLVKHNTIFGVSDQFEIGGAYLSAYVWSPDRSTLYFTPQTGGVKQLDFASTKILNTLPSVITPYVKLIGFGANDQELIVSDGASEEGVRKVRYYSFNLVNREVKELFSYVEGGSKADQ